MSAFRRALANARPLLLDGAMGTMLQQAGLPPGESPERYCLANPEKLLAVHAGYVRAGADILLSCTFGATSYKLPPGLDVEDCNETLARLARRAAGDGGGRVFVAGDIGPSGRFPAPLGDEAPSDMLDAFRAQVRGLARGGVDLLFAETQFDLAEARLIAAAVRAECDLPLVVSMTFEQGVSLTGTDPETFAATMANMGVDAIGVNCGAGPEQMGGIVRRFLAAVDLPVCVQPNAGVPELADGATIFPLAPRPFAEDTAAFAALGVKIVGGCCGTTPEHIAALRRAVDDLPGGEPARERPPSGLCLTTRGALVRLGGEAPLRIIGERINPTGKKAFQAELAAGQWTQALRFAQEQIQAGAMILDVNVGAPMVDEAVVLPEIVRQIGARHNIPLCLDSSDPQAVAAALPHVSGSCLVNSINGDPGRMEFLGPLCARWGAPFILLPIRGSALPVTAKERIAGIEALLCKAESLGIPRRLIAVDVLALAVASKPEAAREALETIRWCASAGLPTLIGLSNISFGLPARELINAAFLSMCAAQGLSGCIANPGSARIREALAACDVLLGRDAGAQRFIGGYAAWRGAPPSPAGSPLPDAPPAHTPATASTPRSRLAQAVIDGEREDIETLVRAALSGVDDPFALVRETLIPAITEVGGRYERREYFLPQLLRSAQAMQAAFAWLKPLMEQDKRNTERDVVILATVEGDIHDIGKNIVALMLGNYGFEVIDLGKDVKARDIVDAAQRHHAAVIGLSALMTTTMIRMRETISLVRERAVPVRVLVGGAVVTADFARTIGADGYAPDAVGAVREARRVLDMPRGRDASP
jgi:5-methyltetrahydrofolate--homocysteine methyltransferase